MAESTIIIPVYNLSALTARCLEILLSQGHRRVVVVDDGSTDDTSKMLAGYGDQIRVITHASNFGFGVSCNDGAAAADTEFVVFLNNDTTPRGGWLDALEWHAQRHPEAAAVGSKLLYPDNTIQHAGVVICQDRYPRHIYSGFPADHPAVNRSRRFQIVTAACQLLRHKIFLEFGGFAPDFRNGFEDVDLCLRLGAAGHQVHYCPDSVVEHHESVSPNRFKWDRENVQAYRRKWMKRVDPDDLRYYQEDGLLEVNYEGRYPINVQLSPLLATVASKGEGQEMERTLRERSRQVAELSRENTRLRIELGNRSQDAPLLRYHELRKRIRETVRRLLPAGATVLVISKGDGALLDLPGSRGWHFPQADHGAYAGHHPADSAEAISLLEALRSRGADHLLIPATSLWWLDHYEEFRQHLDAHFKQLEAPRDTCLVFNLATIADRSHS